jgi:alkylation response protein AidB-like acyl-CoA dehydrogenase
VRHGSSASGFIVIARDPARGPVAAFADASAPEVAVMPRDSFDRASVVADVRFDHVHVAARQELSWADAVLLKGYASQAARQVGESALQVHGGIAFTGEFENNRWFLRALTLQGLYGDDGTSFRHIGSALLTGDLEP